jgi:hypothetical protein
MPITALSALTPQQVHQRVAGFARRYVADWEAWLATPGEDRVHKFGSILRKWQATRPYTMRRPRGEGKHDPPFLEDLIAQARPHLGLIRGLTIRDVRNMGSPEEQAVRGLWSVFRHLAVERPASCVGISKAVLLLTDGRIGPSLDSRVRAGLRIERVDRAADWIAVLVEVSQDILAYEQRHGTSLHESVPEAFGHLEEGRLCDMVFGPRER